MTLTEFLLARIAEDEAAAHDAGMPHKTWEQYAGDHDFDFDLTLRFNPARVLAECAAKRRIIELRYSWNLQAERAPEPPFGPILKAQVITADTILRTLAAVYGDHPDYDEDWLRLAGGTHVAELEAGM